NPAVGRNADGRLEVFVRGGDNGLWHRSQQANAATQGIDYFNWSGWDSLGGPIAGNPVVAENSAHRLNVFARTSDNFLWYRSETTADARSWASWQATGGYIIGDPAVALDAENRLELFVRSGG